MTKLKGNGYCPKEPATRLELAYCRLARKMGAVAAAGALSLMLAVMSKGGHA